MRILIINNNSKSKGSIDGISKSIYNFYSKIDKKEFDIDFVFACEPYDDLWDLMKKSGSNLFILKRTERRVFSYIKELQNIIKKRDYQIVYAHGNSSTLVFELFAAKSAGVKVRIAHGHSSGSKYKILHFALMPFFQRLYTHSFACSEMAGRWLFGNKPFHIVNNAINISAFMYDEQLKKDKIEKYCLAGKTVVGHVGNFYEAKNHEFLIRTFAEYRKINANAVLFLVGEGSLRQSMHDLTVSLNIEDAVVFAGARNDVHELLNMFDCFVFPSLHEGLAIALVEAQANGLTIIASKNRIPKDVAINSNFYFYPLEEREKNWAEKMASVSFERCLDVKGNLIEAGFCDETEVCRVVQRLRDIGQ